MLIRVVIVAIMGLPVAAALLADGLARSLGCSIAEAAPMPCSPWGLEIAPILYDLFVLGWLSVITIPLGVVVLVAHEILRFVMRGRWP